jgi:L-lactate dehydrogenase complex protein LldG
MSQAGIENLVREFSINAERAAATVERVQADAESVHRALLRATAGAPAVLVAPPVGLPSGLLNRFLEDRKVITAPSGDELKTVRLGVTEAFCGVASTGSVCVSLTEGLAGPISMLTRKHIVLLDARAIVPRPRDLFSPTQGSGKAPGNSSCCFTFITGPSATADMGPLVRGVHGPGQLHIILLG